MRKIILFVLGLFFLLSCNQKPLYKESNFIFQLPEKEIFVKTSKRSGGKFVVFFALDSLALDNKQDSVELKTGNYIYIFVDTTNVYIYLYGPPIPNIKHQYFNINSISRHTYERFHDRFYDSKKPKSPYSFINIDSGEYHISVNGKRTKIGDLYGGW